MPATSRRPELFCAALREAALRLALEVDEHHVVLRDQNLAEMKSPWMRVLQAGVPGPACMAASRV